MIGNRLKLKRQADRLSLQDLADLLSEYGVSTTKAVLSNYEIGRVEPNREMTTVLCQALGISEKFLHHEDSNVKLHYFTQIGFVPKRQVELDCYIACHMERRIDIDKVLQDTCTWQKPERKIIANKEDLCQIPAFAEQVRKRWGLNDQPISSVTFVLEQQGWDIFELPESFGLSGVCGYEGGSGIPFVYYPTKAGLVNVRMQILCLVATAYMDIQDPKLKKDACNKFARAILLTQAQAIHEFGPTRKGIAREELEFCKHHYGLPKYEIMGRLQELGIIQEQMYRNYMSRIRQLGYPSARDSMAEPLFFYENSTLYKKKLHYAVAEGLLAESELDSVQTGSGTHR